MRPPDTSVRQQLRFGKYKKSTVVPSITNRLKFYKPSDIPEQRLLRLVRQHRRDVPQRLLKLDTIIILNLITDEHAALDLGNLVIFSLGVVESLALPGLFLAQPGVPLATGEVILGEIVAFA